MLKAIKKKLIQLFFPHRRSSYSQSGEDILISDLFSRLGIAHPSYLDIGANEPMALSNTYRLYRRGSTGICIEPNPILYKKLKNKRKRDVCINAGIAFDEKREADYYLFEKAGHGFSTFSKEDADFWQNTGTEKVGKYRIEQVLKIPLIPLNEIIEKYFLSCPNFISIDVEGLDLKILQSLNFEIYKPDVFCAETLVYRENNKETKNNELIHFLESKGYFIYADTYINTIFCRKDAYSNISFSSS